MPFNIKHYFFDTIIYHSDKASDLRSAILEAIKSGANLSYANLTDANLSGASLIGASLIGASLTDASLIDASLIDANLSYANLTRANLIDASLIDANLSYANLSSANLSGASLTGAKLTKTVLDPKLKPAKITNKTLEEHGLEVRGQYVYGYRTARSQHVGSTDYVPGQAYKAAVFSKCPETPCHPGIYLAGLDWLKREYPNSDLVKVRCKRGRVVKAGDKFRTDELEVLEAVR